MELTAQQNSERKYKERFLINSLTILIEDKIIVSSKWGQVGRFVVCPRWKSWGGDLAHTILTYLAWACSIQQSLRLMNQFRKMCIYGEVTIMCIVAGRKCKTEFHQNTKSQTQIYDINNCWKRCRALLVGFVPRLCGSARPFKPGKLAAAASAVGLSERERAGHCSEGSE